MIISTSGGKCKRSPVQRVKNGFGMKGGDGMEIIIKGEPEEIAALVVAIQERRLRKIRIKMDGKKVARVFSGAIRDTPGDKK